MLLGEWFLTFQTNVASYLKESECPLLGYLDPRKRKVLVQIFYFSLLCVVTVDIVLGIDCLFIECTVWISCECE